MLGVFLRQFWRSRRSRLARRVVQHKLLYARDHIRDFGVSKQEAEYFSQLGVKELRNLITAREITCEKLTRIACIRARWAGDQYNAVAEECFLEAIIESVKRDKIPHYLRGPMHGIPITVADDIMVAGMDSTLGQVERLFRPAHGDASIVRALRNSGAVIICKSNQAGGFTCPRSASSSIYGSIANPWSPNTNIPLDAACGGAACLAAVRAGWLHVVSDMKGTACSASHICGVSDFTPSSTARVHEDVLPAKSFLAKSPGFIARSAEDIQAALKIFPDSNSCKVTIPRFQSFESSCSFVSASSSNRTFAHSSEESDNARNHEYCSGDFQSSSPRAESDANLWGGGNLVGDYDGCFVDEDYIGSRYCHSTVIEKAAPVHVGVVTNCEIFGGNSLISRVSDEAAKILERQGYSTVDFEFPISLDELVPAVISLQMRRDRLAELGVCEEQPSQENQRSSTLPEQNASLRVASYYLSNRFSEVPHLIIFASLPPWLQRSVVWIVRNVLQAKISALLLEGINAGLYHSNEKLIATKDTLATGLTQSMKEKGICAIVLPPVELYFAQTRSKSMRSKVAAFAYSSICYAIGFPIGSVPIFHTRSFDVNSSAALSEGLEQTLHRQQETDESIPMNCSVFAASGGDHVCLQVMQEIAEFVNFRCEPKSAKSFISRWPGPLEEGRRPSETQPLLASESQDWIQEFVPRVLGAVRRTTGLGQEFMDRPAETV